ncbi:MAG: tRNA (cytidine(34)-2'-O)-methyltransferase [Eubacteriales bacterium]|nr:tRNA (cytidine(34)-2'-O)-methyltransferase [Eubacteriales bacterium]
MNRKNIIALIEAEIPYNTGNIARTCVATGSALHLVKPLGFELSDKHLKRAGLDYWYDVDLTLWESFAEFKVFLEAEVESGYFPIYATTKAKQHLGALKLEAKPAIILFGKETAGLPEDFLLEHPERCYRIPMLKDTRSLNLSNAEAIILYEVLRQQGFAGLV